MLLAKPVCCELNLYATLGVRDARSYVSQAIRQEHGINEGTLAILCNALARIEFTDDNSWCTLSRLVSA